jgi:hypothetical protein
MNSMRSYLNRGILPSTRSMIARTRKSQTSLLGALALCAAMLAASTPVYPASRDANTASPGNGGKIAPTETVEEAAALHHTLQIGRVIPEGQAQVHSDFYYGYWTVHPYATKGLVFEYAYDAANCKWVSAGSWYNSSPIYPSSKWYNALDFGYPSQKTILVEVTSGRCAGYKYKAAAAYFYWDKHTGAYYDAALGATWKGAGLSDRWDFLLYLR